jgi:uncharacterized protein YjbI with pentapeptide repeats
MDLLALWHEVTLSAGVIAGGVAFFRGLEQRKDVAFADAMTRLCNGASPVLRAGAARQLPSLHRYRRFVVGRRAYARQALELAVDALKVDQTRFVRQALVESLMQMLPSATGQPRVRLDHACLDELTMLRFNFDYVELAKASIRSSGLEGASFVGANCWSAVFHGSALKNADFSGAMLWDADFSNTDLQGAKLLPREINHNTRFTAANLRDAVMSRPVYELCALQGCDLSKARVQ